MNWSTAACLWVLAEHAGAPVDRARIIKEARLTCDPLDLKVIVSNVRKTLRESYRKAFEQGSARGETLPEDCFLPHAPRGRPYDLGPYMLRVAPERVLIRGDRPLWLKPRTHA